MKPNPLSVAAAGAAFLAADRAGILHALSQPVKARQVAESLGLKTEAVQTVLEVLRSQSIVEAVGRDRYRATAGLEAALQNPLAARPGYWSELFGHTEAFLKTGQALQANTHQARERGEVYAQVTSYLAKLFDESARTLAEELPALPPGAKILDIGAGSAVWSLPQLAGAQSGAHLTVFDLEPVLPTALRHGQDRGLSDHITACAGDYRRDKLPRGPFDRVILANVLHLEPPLTARALLHLAAEVTAPEGELVIVDALEPRNPAEDCQHSAYALYLSLRVTGARVHRESELRGWLAEVGRVEISRVDLGVDAPGPSALVAVRRTEDGGQKTEV